MLGAEVADITLRLDYAVGLPICPANTTYRSVLSDIRTAVLPIKKEWSRRWVHLNRISGP